MANSHGGRSPTGSLATGGQLEAIAASGGAATSSQVAQDTGMDKKTANDALRRLTDTGYLVRPGLGDH
ncbi:MarR family transcriptional regulator [Candidatus Poriferisocius sp.]|uniref:MarR family transcriptional regulator n=1 Tax=Candidatus Poriferisocius sp. TaxID=3101276 RepID=UPI003B022363